MCHQLLSDVQSTNLQLLHVILVGTERDRVGTCRKFSMNAAQVDHLRAMNPADIWGLVHAIGETSLFVPRNDFVTLMNTPPLLAGTLAAAHPPNPTVSLSIPVGQ